MFLRQIPDHALAQYAYLIGCQRTGEAILIDPERDVDRYLALAAENDLRITAVAETHIHADYLSGARELVERHGVRAYLSGEGGADWQFEWALGHPAARIVRDGDRFQVGNIDFEARLTPGHTPEHMSFLVTDRGGGADQPMALLSGDFLFVGDVGRPDLLESAAGQAGVMEPSARLLYDSLRNTAALPDHLQILPAHGAGSACGKALGAVPVSVMGYERLQNTPLREALGGEREAFVRQILSGQPEPPLYFARMKRDNKRGPALLPEGRLPRPRRVTAADLATWRQREDGVVLDLRVDRHAFAAGHVPGALFAPLAGGRLPIAAGSYVAEDKPMLLLVEREEDVEEAVRQLVRIGLDRVEGWLPVGEALAGSGPLARLRSLAPEEMEAGQAVLDVRGAEEFAASHVKGARHIAYTRLAARLDEVPAAAPLHVHCAGGMRAAMAAAYLASTGREVIWVDGLFGNFPQEIVEGGPA